MREESVDKLGQLLKMLDSQIILDHRGTFGMEEDAKNLKKPGTSRKRHRSLTGSRTNLSSRQTLTFDSDSNNNGEEDQNQEDNADQRHQMLTILREEKRKNIIPPPLSPALSSSTFKSPARPRTPGPASQTLKNKEGPERSSSNQTANRRLTVGSQIPSFLAPLEKKASGSRSSKARRLTVSGSAPNFLHHDAVTNFQDLDMAMGTARNTRSDPKKSSSHKLAVSTGVTVKKEKLDFDDGYESLLAPVYDQINDVEVVATIHTCPFCYKVFNRMGKMRSHVAQAHPDPKTVKHYKCPHCDWSSTNPGSLKSHIVQKHKDKVEVYRCDKCDRKYTNKQLWHRHVTSCGREGSRAQTRQTCLRCQTTFQSKKVLGIHQKNHCKDPVSPPYKCKTCSQTFNRLAGLSKHLLTCLEMNRQQQMLKDNDGDDNEDDEHLDTNHGDLDDTREDHVSCKECGHKLFTKENFERHQQQTGHMGETIRLPSNLSI